MSKQTDNSKLLEDKLYPLGHTDDVEYSFTAEKGLTEGLVRKISSLKEEPKWMLEIRLKAYKKYLEMKMPTWGGDLSSIDFDDIRYYIKPKNQEAKTWADVPEAIKNTFEKIGVPEAERETLAGVKSQYDSEVVYGSLKKSLSEKGVIFLSMDEGLREYPEIVKEHFGKVIPMGDNKMAALNTAVWSGGSFVYVPKNVDVGLPLQAYFRINTERAGQFERTLIIAEEDSKMHYIEGCSAPSFSSASLHAAVVEIYVKKNAKVQYSTVQNWFKNVYNLVTKRAKVMENAEMRWVDGNLGSHLTMKYPSCILAGRKAHGEVLSIAWAGEGQHQDTGAKMIHLAPETTSQIISKSISKNGGRATYRGMVHMVPGTWGSRSKVVCDALILDEKSRSDTYPVNKIQENEVVLEHEATVSRIGEEQLLYLMSRGIKAEEASTMIVNGFMEPVVKEIPLEYAVEMNRLVGLEMEGSVG
ncbi:Fe-S cluster assembly protein SufB [Candidatus Collierbacteria bacterium CG_4_10_14_0_8_um_filter_43_86]|uniref:Fe-S cluster assembly protein SufB n=2 Tax=Candidatus Collieribacteriota TaxID=1752725 RepID=A0A2H0DUE8_9BACT|nr:Fe-S cluster assembly protein SufB [bacterium]PIP85782.1 MAG: Fe-S cluster assembly protein SufB [Candidatus Collierbacteria bacterium CG22_combo_CG10-13_8_21_14_all_43_12]PIZ24697.1 MAG: Fe-S cluster assembly protein SufB [Candidatus Collierbacteria bacterium CG_4_10_14_0_8_um_filter_43_86]PJB47675.1 MAG: Fe-S cluster assembly protein SufB [Candidatus Collierbacteria bacterium CG_4_9_14_3_um_filter_43_16]